MAAKEEDNKMDVQEAPETLNSNKASKELDVDRIFEEIASENTASKKSKEGVVDVATKSDAPKKTVRRRFFRRGRGFMNRTAKAHLPTIPLGILYVKNGTYIGYHCTFCNCTLKTLFTVKQHVAGARHRETLKTKEITDESAERKIDSLPSTSSMRKDTVKSNLKSSLNEYLATTTEPIVGLGHIVETVIPGKAHKFECKLCRFYSNFDEMKEHISGTRHRLMCLKTIDPKKIAEMMSKNLSKNERNEKIISHAKELEEKYGRGSINIKSSETTGTLAQKEMKHQGGSRGRSSRNRTALWRAQERIRGRGRGSVQRGRLGSANRGTRGIRGQNRPLIRGGRRGNLTRGRAPKGSLSRRNPERRQSVSKRFRGHGARVPEDSFPAGEPYFTEYADIAMRTGRDPYADSFGRNPYYPDPYSVPKESYVEDPYERKYQLSPEEYSSRQGYRPPFDDEPPREYGPSDGFQSREYRSVSPSRSRSSHHKLESAEVEESHLKNLSSLKVANEKEAGVVMSVITSLAESLLGYKLRGSGSSQEILQKLEEERKQSLSHPDKSDVRETEKFSRDSDTLDHSSQSWHEMRAKYLDTYEERTLPPRSVRDRSPPRSVEPLRPVRERSPPRRPMEPPRLIRDRSPPRRPIEPPRPVRDRSPPRRSVELPRPLRDRSPARRIIEPPRPVRDRSPPRRSMEPPRPVRDRSPPRRPIDNIQEQSQPLPRRPVDPVRERSPPPPRRPLDMQGLPSSPPRRPMDIMRDRSPPPARRPMDMRDRSPPLPRRPVDIWDRSSPPKRPMGITHDQSLSQGRPINVMHEQSLPLSRRPIDAGRNISPSLIRASLVMQNRTLPSPKRPGAITRDRSPPLPRNHPSYVDDLFDDYQKSQNAIRSSYVATPNNALPAYRNSFSSPSSYGTPASSYASPLFNVSSGFSRSNDARRLPPSSGFTDNQERNVLDWKYRSLR